jgi:hypothetical protein
LLLAKIQKCFLLLYIMMTPCASIGEDQAMQQTPKALSMPLLVR